MPESVSNQDNLLPEKYYLTYFLDLIDFIQKHSGHLIGVDEELFLTQFFQLSENAQCLFIRFCNRKGPYFRLDKLDYPEISIESASEELLHQGFISEIGHAEADILNFFTKSELLNTYQELGISRSISKGDLIDILLEEDNFDPLIVNYPLVKVELQDAVEYLKLLYFGHYKAQMTEFVIRDIGNIQLEDLSQHDFKPWFDTIEESKAVFDISQLYSTIKKALALISASELHETVNQIDFKPFTAFTSSQKILDKLILKMGQQLEREKQGEAALIYYAQGWTPPIRERRVRINYQNGNYIKAQQLAEDILEEPRNATERLFAKDFLNRPKIKILRSTTDKIKSAKKHIMVPNLSQKKVEDLALQHLRSKGYEGIHGENYLWRNLFVLTFWQVLLDDQYSSFHHPLQRVAGDLFESDFYSKRKDALEQSLNIIKSRKGWLKRLNEIIVEKRGINQPFVYWNDHLQDHMTQMITYLPIAGIKATLIEIAKNPKDNSKGFPDLFVWKNKSYWFYEVKSPNDQLSAQQLFWLDFFAENKIKSEVLRVSFAD